MLGKLEQKLSILLVVILLTNFTCGLAEKWVKSSGVANLNCPLEDDPDDPTVLPYPGDCSKFIKCSYGLGFTLSCPRGLHFANEKRQCEYPQVANCNANEVVPPPTIGGGGCNFTYKPHPTDCKKAIQCVNGVEIELECPGGSLWDRSQNKCSFTEVQCY